jgi:AraC family L-rhamnose operon regulatory protein RhaS
MYTLEAKDFFPSPNDTVAVVERNPQEAFPEHAHDFGEIVIVSQGGGCNVINRQASRVCAGSVFYLMPDDRHAFDEVNELCLTNVIFRMPERYQPLLRLHGEPAHGINWEIGGVTRQQVSLLLHRLQFDAAHFSCDMARNCFRDGVFMQLIALLCQARYSCNQGFSADTRTRELLTYLKANFTECIDWEMLARKFGLSLRTLHRKISDQTGLTPARYLAQLRLEQAEQCLRHTRQSITDIAFACGFEDSNYFSTLFRQAYSVSPSQYRARLHTRFVPAELAG